MFQLKNMVEKFFITSNQIFSLKVKALEPQSWDKVLEIDKDDYNFLGAAMDRAEAEQFVRNVSLVAISGLGLVMVGVSVYGAFLWTTAMDNEEKVKKGKKIATGGIIGLLIVVGFIAILGIISVILGVTINDITLNFFDTLLG